MTPKLLCFSGLIALLSFASCGNQKVKKVYSTYNLKGVHSRALAVSENGFVVGGQRGVFSYFSDDFSQITDSLDGATDLRDVHLLSNGSILFINSGEQGRIWKVSADLKTKRLVYDRKDVFLDGLAFWNDRIGVAYGDPIEGKFIVMITLDGGEIWRPLDYNTIPFALPNEAGFAASGTGIAAVGNESIYIGTGMADTARLFISTDLGLSWEIKNTPLKAGESYGVYSMYFWSENEGVIVGGSYLHPEDTVDLCFYTKDAGDSWEKRSSGLGGYTSCIHGSPDGSLLIATGRVGTYYSVNYGNDWIQLLDETFYSVNVSLPYIYFSGKDGKVAVYKWLDH